MICDKCGKEIYEPAFSLEIIDRYPEAQRQLGKYYEAKKNVNLLLDWNFCAECVLDALLNEIQRVPLPPSSGLK